MPIDLRTFEDEFNHYKRMVENLLIAQATITDENRAVVGGAIGRVSFMSDKLINERIAVARAKQLSDELRILKEDFPAVGKMLEEDK
jgi:hypothetical protein